MHYLQVNLICVITLNTALYLDIEYSQPRRTKHTQTSTDRTEYCAKNQTKMMIFK
jgi:hypothetical protein